MAKYTLAQAQEMLNVYMAAEKAIVSGAQSYSIGDRALSRADLEEITQKREQWAALVDQYSSGRTRPKVRRCMPRDN